MGASQVIKINLPVVILSMILSGSIDAGELLDSGKFRFRQGVGIVTAGALWMGSNQKTIGVAPGSQQNPTPTPVGSSNGGASALTSGTSSTQSGGRVTSFLADSSVSVGIPYGIQLDARLVYKYSALSGGDDGGSLDGDSLGGVSEIGFRVNKELYHTRNYGETNFGVVAYTGVRVPGNSPDSPDDFLALNDGATKFDLGVRGGVRFESFSLESDISFIIRNPGGELANQISLNFFVPVYAFPGVTFGPYLGYFTTLFGFDIGSDEFRAIAESQGGVRPFSLVKTEYLSLGAFAVVPVNEQISLDFSLTRKVSGRNTDIGTAFGAGVGLTF